HRSKVSFYRHLDVDILHHPILYCTQAGTAIYARKNSRCIEVANAYLLRFPVREHSNRATSDRYANIYT
ncbi:MAG: hypothetical protein V7K89_24300, partial [Nostoc sp.]|uniref:hypothetical protein n=1 Tax=Nostoc sp. TaxID=1180 RepID=UPI002FF528E7